MNSLLLLIFIDSVWFEPGPTNSIPFLTVLTLLYQFHQRHIPSGRTTLNLQKCVADEACMPHLRIPFILLALLQAG